MVEYILCYWENDLLQSKVLYIRRIRAVVRNCVLHVVICLIFSTAPKFPVAI